METTPYETIVDVMRATLDGFSVTENGPTHQITRNKITLATISMKGDTPRIILETQGVAEPLVTAIQKAYHESSLTPDNKLAIPITYKNDRFNDLTRTTKSIASVLQAYVTVLEYVQ